MKRLSQLQRTILSMAEKKGDVCNADILTAVYGYNFFID
jgi:hypothetical protein